MSHNDKAALVASIREIRATYNIGLSDAVRMWRSMSSAARRTWLDAKRA